MGQRVGCDFVAAACIERFNGGFTHAAVNRAGRVNRTFWGKPAAVEVEGGENTVFIEDADEFDVGFHAIVVGEGQRLAQTVGVENHHGKRLLSLWVRNDWQKDLFCLGYASLLGKCFWVAGVRACRRTKGSSLLLPSKQLFQRPRAGLFNQQGDENRAEEG